MKNLLFILIITFFTLSVNGQNIYKSTDGNVSFFSETPMENIDAENKTLTALLNVKTGEMAFLVTNNGFKFDKPLMEEHFNENYIESDKYKVSSFKGKVAGEGMDLNKNGTYQVIAKGTLDMHGVEKEREIEGVITVKDGKINLSCEFDIALKDHKIKIPKLVTEKIAESVLVKVNINLSPKTK